MPATTRSETRKYRRTIHKPAPETRKLNFPDGVHKVEHRNGNTYWLPMRDGRINGAVRWRGKDHSVDAEYKDGQQHGYERVYWDDGATAESLWRDGIKEGVEIKRTPADKTVCITTYKDGKKEGPGITYHERSGGEPVIHMLRYADNEELAHNCIQFDQNAHPTNLVAQPLVVLPSTGHLPTAEVKRDVFARLSNAIEEAKEELTGAKYLELCNASQAAHSIVSAL